MLCKAPFLGMTIDPNGWLTLCCNTSDRTYFKTKITDIEDLNDFFLGEKYNHIRDIMKKEGMFGLEQCKGCWAAKDGYWEEINNYNNKSYDEPLKIRYLELTTSNICNQTCVTCGSYFSSKWRKLESQFGRDVSPSAYLDSESIEKIIKVLPDLKYIQIKGGEPFADKNNLKILKKLSEVNPDCQVIITSNFQHISDEWWPILKLLKNIRAGASVDGIGKSYDWIRGGNFKDTEATMRKFALVTKQRVTVNVCVSLYNIFELKQIKDYFSDKFYVDNILLNNIVTYPDELSINLLSKNKLNEAINVFGEDESVSNIRMIESKPSVELNNKFYTHTETMNRVRKFDIFEHQPYLRDIFKAK